MIGRLLSVNVGGPREIEWEGKTVRTAIWKEPVAGPRMVRRINIDGDDQADRLAHGGEHRAVFVYQIDSYRYWERELGRSDFTYGQFGENFTVEGLADDEVCIGDRYRIGDALFEVTQPRVTCYRVGIRMAEPAMPSLLVAHHRPGFYLRVLEEGSVQAGDADRQGRRRARATDGRAGRRAPLPPQQVARAARAGHAGACAQRGLEGELPRAARQGRGRHGACAGVARVPAAARGGGPPGERDHHLVSARADRRHAVGPERAGRPVPDRAPEAGRRRAAAHPQLLALGPPGRARLPDQRQARGGRKPLPASAREGRRSHRRRRPSRQLRPARRDPAGRADQRRSRRDPRPRDAARARRRAHHQAGLVGARCAQPRRARLRRGGRRAPRRAREGPSSSGVQPARARGGARLRLRRRGPTRSRGPRTRRGPQGRRLLPLRTRGVHARDRRRTHGSWRRPRAASPARPSAPSPCTPPAS